ncbi:hypothetical protein SSX86_006105 [Deinandra increscens subsp. villosa]|uniref:Uncharacterized protein n=1 Tax=Deinandra increscens subsp. villosa TaxID=3103831 RepID=A0AAP0DRQ9_9ASTR
MAGAGASAAIAAAATTSSPFPPPPPRNSRVLASSLPSSFPPRERRTNHLRKKILKTLENKPYPDPSQPEFPLKTPSISVAETVQQHPAESDQFSLSQGAGFLDGILGTFSTKSFAKIGLYLVGAFIFQTVCAVLIFGSNDLLDKDDNLSSNGHENDRKSKLKSNLLLSGNRSSIETKEGGNGNGIGMGLVDESEMDNRIMEIQEMARLAREQEKMEAKRKGLVEEEDDGDVDYDLVDKAMKMKEVDDRLSKMRRSLEGEYHKPAPKFPRKVDDVGNNVDNNIDYDSLMFKKKYKYKSPSIESGDKPKGFGGTKDIHVANGSPVNGLNGITVDDGNLQTDKKDGEMFSNDVESESEISVSKYENKEQEPRETKTESLAGTSKEPKHDKQTSKAEKSGKLSNLETKKPRGFGKDDDFNKNGSLKGKKGRINKSSRNLEVNFSTQTNFWWTRLPYVMAVKMQCGGNGEESSGLFIVRNTSGLHHAVAFEDNSDATNFCYFLESFFEDLQDFSTTIIPIPTNVLEEEIKSQTMKVVVVKKRQLKLYVGQPLEDVESALRALIEQQSE